MAKAGDGRLGERVRTLRKSMRLGTIAYDNDVAFDTARLPHRLTVNAGRGCGWVLLGFAVAIVLFQVIIIFEERYGPGQHRGAGGIDRFTIFMWFAAAAFLAGFTWFATRRDDIEISRERVRVRQQRLWGGETWEVPLGEYLGVLRTYTWHPDSESMLSTDVWGICLHHADPTRTVSLWMGLRHAPSEPEAPPDWAPTDIINGQRDWRDVQVELSKRWARDLGLPLLESHDGKIKEIKGPPGPG